MKKEIKCPSGQHIRLDGKKPRCHCYKENWRKQLKREFGIHFKDSPGELQFLEAFIEDLLKDERKNGHLNGWIDACLEIKKRKNNEKTPPQIQTNSRN